MIDMVSTIVAPLLAIMTLLLPLLTKSTNTRAKISRQHFTSTAKLLFARFANRNIQTQNVDRWHVLALSAFTKALINIHIVLEANCVLTDFAFVLLWLL